MKKSATRKSKPSTESNGGDAAQAPTVNVKKLREDLGKGVAGGKPVSRGYLAGLLGTSMGSVMQWEKGNAPRAANATKLAELEARVAKGDFAGLPAPKKRGRQPKGTKAGGRPKTAAPVVQARKAPTTTMSKWTATDLAKALYDFAETAKNPQPLRLAARSLLDE